MITEHEFLEKNRSAGYASGARLLADIGATQARFTLELAPGRFEAVEVLKCDDYAGIVPLVRAYLSKQDAKVNHAAFAIANPVDGDHVRMTNRDWEFSIEDVRREFGLYTLLIVNDFTALAMSLPGLLDRDRVQIGGGKPEANSVIGVLGPGTGLGVSGLIPHADGFVTLGSEGGHVNFAPADEREYAILQAAWQEFGSHVSTERLISGPGIEVIYRALAARNKTKAAPRSAAEITRAALSDGDALCLETIEVFAGMLGSFAANLAVTLGAFGGIYIGGGIVPQMADWFASSSFRARFEAKGRFTPYVMQIPTYLITTPNPAFYGVSAILSEHLRGRSGESSLLDRIAALQPELSPAERRVASLVLENPRTVVNEAIAEIARLADVSQPTVIRFCRSLGFLGLADFKLKFASSLTGTIPVRHSQVRTSDSTHDLSAKVIDNTVSAILAFRDQLDVHSLDQAIELVRKANRVEFYAVGNSRVVALDGQHKFFRFRIPTASYGDAHLFTLAAELLRPGDVVIVISNSGKLPELLKAVDAAREAGADVIAITPSQSPLAKKAKVCLAVNHTEDSTTFLSMISRILQLLLIDILSVGISVESQQEGGVADEAAKATRLLISHLDS